MAHTILIVDDEPEVLNAVSLMVRHEGYDVMHAESGEQALSILSRRPFDMVMTDLMMPGINGWQLLEAVKQASPDTKVVVFTGYIDDQGEAILTDRQADGFLTKPIDISKLRALLASLFSTDEIIGARVVAVDDEPGTLKMVEAILSKEGVTVAPFEAPTEALASAVQDPPNLFLIDLEMPQISGFELCEKIRDTEGLSHLPVIILTAHAEREIVLKAIGLDVQGFVLKPYDAVFLVDKVRKVIASHRASE